MSQTDQTHRSTDDVSNPDRPPDILDIQFARVNATANVVSLEVCDVFRNEPRLYEHNAQPPAGSLTGSASARQPITTYAVERSERSTLLAQALHKRAAARTWLPLRTIFSSEPVALLGRSCSAMGSGSRRSAAAVLAHRSARRTPQMKRRFRVGRQRALCSGLFVCDLRGVASAVRERRSAAAPIPAVRARARRLRASSVPSGRGSRR